jgi:hypothetical protein
MAQDRSQPLGEINFICPGCRERFKAAPGTVTPAPELEAHPYRYAAPCPECGTESPQAPWERNILQAWAKATGPRTPEGKAATAANLVGHPTPEEALRTRFNAMQHGLYARTATYFPAKPDKYAACAHCDVDREWCGQQVACVKQTGLFMLHHAAFEQGNPKVLRGMYADLQSAVFSVLQQILQTIIADGAKITTPEWYTDKEGKVCLVEYFDEKTLRFCKVMNIEAHPLFRPLGELLTRANLSLSDMGMTAKVTEDDDEQLGRLAISGQTLDVAEYARSQAKSFAALKEAVERAQSAAKRDPILIEHQQQGGS